MEGGQDVGRKEGRSGCTALGAPDKRDKGWGRDGSGNNGQGATCAEGGLGPRERGFKRERGGAWGAVAKASPAQREREGARMEGACGQG